MSKPDRSIEPFIAVLQKAHEKYPDMRVGQLIKNALSGRGDFYTVTSLIENPALVAAIEEFLE